MHSHGSRKPINKKDLSIVLGGVLFSLIMFVDLAHADNQVSLDVLLAQQCVGEIDLRGKNDECSKMWFILREKVGANNFEHIIRKYNTAFKVNTPRSRWIRGLNKLGTKPVGWPSKLSWKKHRELWLGKLNYAQQWLKDPGENTCKLANQYGGRCDNDKHACDKPPPCWRRLWCGKHPSYYAQAYYHRPAGGCSKTVSALAVREAYSDKED